LHHAGLLLLGQIHQLKDPFASITDEDAWDILVGFGWLFGAAFALLIIALLARKWFMRDSFGSEFGGSSQYSLNDLRKMREDGLLSPEEFEKAKIFLVARGKSLVETDEPERPPDV
jgi:hypothetical protein